MEGTFEEFIFRLTLSHPTVKGFMEKEREETFWALPVNEHPPPQPDAE